MYNNIIAYETIIVPLFSEIMSFCTRNATPLPPVVMTYPVDTVNVSLSVPSIGFFQKTVKENW